MNNELKYALLCGTALSLWVLIEFALGFHTTSLEIGQYSGFFSILIPIILIFSALQERQKQSGSLLSWTVGIDSGFRIAFYSALLFTMFMVIYRLYINPDWLEATIEWQRKKLILGGASDDEIGRFMESSRTMNSLPVQIITGFVGSTTVGVIVTLIEIPVLRVLARSKKQ
ncbi:MAG: DUF4199 domain-containing protein [Bacteroidota bacterium]